MAALVVFSGAGFGRVVDLWAKLELDVVEVVGAGLAKPELDVIEAAGAGLAKPELDGVEAAEAGLAKPELDVVEVAGTGFRDCLEVGAIEKDDAV